MAENPCPIPTDMDAMCVAITAATWNRQCKISLDIMYLMTHIMYYLEIIPDDLLVLNVIFFFLNAIKPVPGFNVKSLFNMK